MTWSPSKSSSGDSLAMIVAVPITVGMPLTIVAIPPSVIGIPAAFAFGIQIMPALLGLVTAFAVFANCLLKLCFPAFDFALTFRVGRIGKCRDGHHRRSHGRRHHCCECKPFQSS
jgi:hypothetical protein